MNNFLEVIIFFYVIKHPDLTQSFKGQFFNTKAIKELFDIVKPHVIEYKSEPTKTQVIDLVKVAGKDEIISEDEINNIWKSHDKVNEYTEDWLRSNTTSFAEWQNLMTSLKRVLTYVKSIQSDITFENCREIVERVKSMFTSDTNFSMSTSKGHDFFDPESHAEPDVETQSSGYPFIDICMAGGWSKKTLSVFMAPPKTGKTKWLCNLAKKSVINGNNTAYITLEVKYQTINRRIGSNMFDIPIDEYKEKAKDVTYMADKIKSFMNSHSLVKPGKLIVEEFPTASATVYDIESFIKRKEEELSTPDKPFKFDNVFIDYINIMKDFRNPNSENLYIKIKNIAEDVRAMAQRNYWSVISCTQTNRGAFDATDMTMSNVSESAGLLATVDFLFGIIQNPLMRAEGTYYLKAVAVRDSGSMGNKKKYKEDFKYLRIEEDENEPIIMEGNEIPKKYDTSILPKFENSKSSQSMYNDTGITSGLNLGLSEQEIATGSLFT